MCNNRLIWAKNFKDRTTEHEILMSSDEFHFEGLEHRSRFSTQVPHIFRSSKISTKTNVFGMHEFERAKEH